MFVSRLRTSTAFVVDYRLTGAELSSAQQRLPVALFRGQFDNQPPVSHHNWIRQRDKSGVWLTGKSADRCVDFIGRIYAAIDSLDPLGIASFSMLRRILISAAGFLRTAMRVNWGAIPLSNWSHFPPIAGSKFANPVILPPGRARFVTKRPPGRRPPKRRSELVVLPRNANRTDVPSATRTCGALATNSEAWLA